MHDDGTSIIEIEYIGIPVDVAYPVVSSDSTSTLNQNTGGYPLDDRQMNLTLQINRATGNVKRVTYFVEY